MMISVIVGIVIVWAIFYCIVHICMYECYPENSVLLVIAFIIYSFFTVNFIACQCYGKYTYVQLAIVIYFAISAFGLMVIYKCLNKHRVPMYLMLVTICTIGLVVATHKDFDKKVISIEQTEKAVSMYEDGKSIKKIAKKLDLKVSEVEEILDYYYDDDDEQIGEQENTYHITNENSDWVYATPKIKGQFSKIGNTEAVETI